ncbi:MAG: amidophosphoribosyltransferase [Lachnospiraceae bacterium]|nr:amidophosphoribosyltransferase [Lachnospiraceae bacterium]
MAEIREECGLFGIRSDKVQDLAHQVYYGLFSLQHRGQESCGIVVENDGLFSSYKDSGIVNDVFTPERLQKLGEGDMAIGHVRYGTAATRGRANAQPLIVNHIKGRMALAHNGNLVNSFELRSELELKGSIFQTNSDTEVISYIITEERLNAPTIEEAVNRAMYRLKGAYSLVIMSPSKLIAARDENGFRPLCYGRTEDGGYVVASESCALDAVGATLVRDVRPGEILIFSKDGVRSIEDHVGKAPHKLCVFEYVYFARPDSVIDGCNVHEARKRAGQFLAQEHPVDADLVVGVPDSGLDAAVGYSMESGIPYGIGFVKNKYIARTFIAPGQEERMDRVRIKLNPIQSVVNGKRIVLIDDSIVRGTTCARIVKLLREAGATEVHVRLSSPPFMNPCYYGTDIDSRAHLIACRHDLEGIRKIIGADTLGYLSLDAVKQIAVSELPAGYCTACFDGVYPTDVPEDNRKSRYEQGISQSEKFKEAYDRMEQG